jgi:GMP synthase (glutamine-hydrolysing)
MLLLSVRSEDIAADDEYAAMLRFSGLDQTRLQRVRLDRQPLAPRDLDLARWSGFILGGGSFNVSDPVEVKTDVQRRVEAELALLLDSVIAQDLPFLGCCYGIGAVGSQIGATIDRTFTEPVGSVSILLTEHGRADPLFAGMPSEFQAFVGHKEAISKLGDDAVVLASSSTCPVQAFRIGQNVYATQFHPELDVEGICTRIEVYRNYGYFAPDAAETLKAQMRRRDVVYPPTILRNFVDRYGRQS